MSTTEKGDRLENTFFQYLLEQQENESLIFDVYTPTICKVFKQKKYDCGKREAPVTFDVVIELWSPNVDRPHLTIVFECKNHKRNLEEIYVNDFSKKLDRIFGHSAKGVIVTSSRLQSGAENVAKNIGLGIVKFDGHGFETIIARSDAKAVEDRYVAKQLFEKKVKAKPLKFSAYYNGQFSGSITQFLMSIDPSLSKGAAEGETKAIAKPPFVSGEEIQKKVQSILDSIEYEGVAVDLKKVCSTLSIELKYSAVDVQDDDGNSILGSANFDRKIIQINLHDNEHRERFTLGHEIGHFYLEHGKFLKSESIIERDLFFGNMAYKTFKYETLEIQANTFASYLLMPNRVFLFKLAEYCKTLGIHIRDPAQIFVDDQPSNYRPYGTLLAYLSEYFCVSKQAVGIRLNSMKLLNDQRKQFERYKFKG